jgi:nucleoside-triphosphatase THEP1
MQDVDFPKTNLASALMADMVHQNVLVLGFLEREIRSLLQHTGFSQIPDKSHQ